MKVLVPFASLSTGLLADDGFGLEKRHVCAHCLQLTKPIQCFANCESQNALVKGPEGQLSSAFHEEENRSSERSIYFPKVPKLSGKLHTQPHIGEHTRLPVTNKQNKKGKRKVRKRSSRRLGYIVGKKLSEVPSNDLAINKQQFGVDGDRWGRRDWGAEKGEGMC